VGILFYAAEKKNLPASVDIQFPDILPQNPVSAYDGNFISLPIVEAVEKFPPYGFYVMRCLQHDLALFRKPPDKLVADMLVADYDGVIAERIVDFAVFDLSDALVDAVGEQGDKHAGKYDRAGNVGKQNKPAFVSAEVVERSSADVIVDGVPEPLAERRSGLVRKEQHPYREEQHKDYHGKGKEQ